MIEKLNFEIAINGLANNYCPFCKNPLIYDVQLDSIYISCGCGNFNISTFLDKYNGDILLYYLNHGFEGNIQKEHLKKLKHILYRKKEVKQKLFNLRKSNQDL